MEQDNKDSDTEDSPIRRIADEIRHCAERYKHTVRDQIVRGVAYGVGSGAVSILILWYEHRH